MTVQSDVARAARQREKYEAEMRDNPSVFVPLHRRLRDLREARGWSRRDLCQAVGVAPSSVQKWEAGQCRPSIYLLNLVFMALQVTWEFALEAVIPTTRDVHGTRRIMIAIRLPKKRVGRIVCKGSRMMVPIYLVGQKTACQVCGRMVKVTGVGLTYRHTLKKGRKKDA